MNPPCMKLRENQDMQRGARSMKYCAYPRSARQTKKDVRPLSQNWPAVRMAQPHIWIGIQTSGPSWDSKISEIHERGEAVRATHPFRDNLRWELGGQERKPEYSVTQVEVYKRTASICKCILACLQRDRGDAYRWSSFSNQARSCPCWPG